MKTTPLLPTNSPQPIVPELCPETFAELYSVLADMHGEAARKADLAGDGDAELLHDSAKCRSLDMANRFKVMR